MQSRLRFDNWPKAFNGKQLSNPFEHLVVRSCRDSKKCRKVLQRAVQSASDNPEMVIQALLSFEREEGELKRVKNALSVLLSLAYKSSSQTAKREEERRKNRKNEKRTTFRKSKFNFTQPSCQKKKRKKRSAPSTVDVLQVACFFLVRKFFE